MATIYRITSTAGDKIYIGSTTKSLARRWSVHKADRLRGHPCTSKVLFDEYGVDSCSIEEIEKVDLDKRIERERFWIENTENCVNRCIPGRTHAEWCLENRERVSEHQKVYRLANKEQRSDYKKAYDLANRERISEIDKAYNKAYRLANLDKIKAHKTERITCPTCGKNLSRGNIARHKKLHL